MADPKSTELATVLGSNAHATDLGDAPEAEEEDEEE